MEQLKEVHHWCWSPADYETLWARYVCCAHLVDRDEPLTFVFAKYAGEYQGMKIKDMLDKLADYGILVEENSVVLLDKLYDRLTVVTEEEFRERLRDNIYALSLDNDFGTFEAASDPLWERQVGDYDMRKVVTALYFAGLVDVKTISSTAPRSSKLFDSRMTTYIKGWNGRHALLVGDLYLNGSNSHVGQHLVSLVETLKLT